MAVVSPPVGRKNKLPPYSRLFLASILLTTTAVTAAAPPQVLSMTAACRDNAACIFDDVGIFIDLTLTNNSSDAIGVPLEFLQQIGPRCVLIDNDTGEKLPLAAPPPADLSLRNKFTPIPPGGSIGLDEFIPASMIKGLREWMIDLTATCAIHVPIKSKGIELPVRQTATTSLRILGRDAAERDDK